MNKCSTNKIDHRTFSFLESGIPLFKSIRPLQPSLPLQQTRCGSAELWPSCAAQARRPAGQLQLAGHGLCSSVLGHQVHQEEGECGNWRVGAVLLPLYL